MASLKRLWHRLMDDPDFRVVYPSGERTRRLRPSECYNLIALYGGMMVYDPL